MALRVSTPVLRVTYENRIDDSGVICQTFVTGFSFSSRTAEDGNAIMRGRFVKLFFERYLIQFGE